MFCSLHYLSSGCRLGNCGCSKSRRLRAFSAWHPVMVWALCHADIFSREARSFSGQNDYRARFTAQEFLRRGVPHPHRLKNCFVFCFFLIFIVASLFSPEGVWFYRWGTWGIPLRFTCKKKTHTFLFIVWILDFFFYLCPVLSFVSRSYRTRPSCLYSRKKSPSL